MAQLIARNTELLKELQHADETVKSFYRVRQCLGLLGFILPIWLALGGYFTDGGVAPSISDTFHSGYRDTLVGALSAIGLFLIVFQGYPIGKDQKISDTMISTLAGVGAIGVAMFPNVAGADTASQVILGDWSPILHFASALVFFVCLTLFCFFKFLRSEHEELRGLFKICGVFLIIATILVIITSATKRADEFAWMPEFMRNFKPIVDDYKLVFWFEALGVWAFAAAWLVKGEADKREIRASRETLKQRVDTGGLDALTRA